MSCLAYSPPCHSAEVHLLSWYAVLRGGSGVQAGRQPRQMKAPEFIENDTDPFLSPTSTSKCISTNAKSCVLWLPQVSLPIPLILLPFHPSSRQLEECGHRQVVLALEDLLTCADSKDAEQACPDFMVQISRLLHAGLSSVHLTPLLTDRAALKSSQEWSQAVPNSALKRCRSSTAPALSSSRTIFYLLEIFGRQSQDGEYLQVSVLHSLCWEMLWNVNFSNDSSFKPFSVLSSLLINSREVILLLSMAATL